jgi:methyl-accepting chemotaxis protein
LAVLSILMFAIVSALSSLTEVHEKMAYVVDEVQPAMADSMELINTLQASSSSMGFYLLAQDDVEKESYLASLTTLETQLNKLSARLSESKSTELIELMARVRPQLVKFREYRKQVLLLASDNSKNIPAVAISTTQLRPLADEVNEQLGLLLLAEKEENYVRGRREFYELINEVRYSWMGVLIEARAFLFGRADGNKDNVEIFYGGVLQSISRLQGMEDLINFEQEEVLGGLDELVGRWKASFDALAIVHQGNRWREDVYLVRTQISPLMVSLSKDLTALAALQHQRIVVANADVNELYNSKRLHYVVLFILAVCIVLAIGWVLVTSISSALSRVVDTIHSIEDTGDFSLRVEVRGDDEIAEITESYNQLIALFGKTITTINNTMEKVSEGHLHVTCELDVRGDLAVLRDHVNHSIHQMDTSVADINRVMAAVAEGDFSQRVTSRTGGDLEKLKNNVNRAIRQLKDTIGQLNTATSKVASGSFDVRIDADSQGELKVLGNNMNLTLEALVPPLRETYRVMESLADGDLRENMDGQFNGEFALLQKAVNTSVNNLEKMVGKILVSSGSIVNEANQIMHGSGELSDRIQQQAASLEETASSMTEMTDTVKQNADNAMQADSLVENASRQAQAGGKVMEKAVTAMQDISDASNKIADIITVIDSIAFQTNLLALNASVEAARAGEQGRGFAVVAGEVGSLAQRSAEAAKQTKMMIEDVVEKVAEGNTMVEDAGSSLNEIVTSVQKIHHIVGEIALASKEQTNGIEQVNRAILRMDEVTQQNAALVEESAGASKSMDQRAVEMKELMDFFQIGKKMKTEVSDQILTYETATDSRPSTVKRADKSSVLGKPKPKSSKSSGEAVPAGKKPVASVGGNDDWEEF